jgi:hypothetical protein
MVSKLVLERQRWCAAGEAGWGRWTGGKAALQGRQAGGVGGAARLRCTEWQTRGWQGGLEEGNWGVRGTATTGCWLEAQQRGAGGAAGWGLEELQDGSARCGCRGGDAVLDGGVAGLKAIKSGLEAG